MDNASSVRFRNVKVATADGDDDGLLVFIDRELAAVLVRQGAEEEARWAVQASFGVAARKGETFATLDSAKRFFAGKLATASAALSLCWLGGLAPFVTL